MMNYYQHQNYNISSSAIVKTPKTSTINVIPSQLYTYLSLSLFFTILVHPDKQFLNLKLLVGFLGQAAKS